MGGRAGKLCALWCDDLHKLAKCDSLLLSTPVYERPALEYYWPWAARRVSFSAWVGLDMEVFSSKFMQQRDRQGVFWYISNCLREAEQLTDIDWPLDVVLGMDVQPATYEQ